MGRNLSAAKLFAFVNNCMHGFISRRQASSSTMTCLGGGTCLQLLESRATLAVKWHVRFWQRISLSVLWYATCVRVQNGRRAAALSHLQTSQTPRRSQPHSTESKESSCSFLRT